MMLGLPGETDDDIDELGALHPRAGRAIAPRVALGIAPFVAKRNTPLDGAPFGGIDVVDAPPGAAARRGQRARSTLRPTSPKWAWVEYRLAQGGFAAGRAAAKAARAGGPLRRLEGGPRRRPAARGGRRRLSRRWRSLRSRPGPPWEARRPERSRAPAGRQRRNERRPRSPWRSPAGRRGRSSSSRLRRRTRRPPSAPPPGS